MKWNYLFFQKYNKLTFIGVAWSIFFVLSSQAQTVLFSNNFDSLSVGQTFTSTAVSGMTGNDDGSTSYVRVSNTYSNSGSNALYEYDNNTTGTPALNISLGQTYTNVSVSFATKLYSTTTFYFTNSSGTSNFILCHENYGANGNSWELRNGSNTVLTYVTDATSGYSASSWNNVTATFNEATNTFSLSYGSSNTNIFSISSGTYDTIDWSLYKFSIGTGWYAGAATSIYNYFDDISIVAIPEPDTASLLFFASGLLGLVSFMRHKSASARARS